MTAVKTDFTQDNCSGGKETLVWHWAQFQIQQEKGVHSQVAGGDGGWKITERKYHREGKILAKRT